MHGPQRKCPRASCFFSDINGAGNILSASFFDKKIDDTLFEILRIRPPQWLEKQGC